MFNVITPSGCKTKVVRNCAETGNYFYSGRARTLGYLLRYSSKSYNNNDWLVISVECPNVSTTNCNL